MARSIKGVCEKDKHGNRRHRDAIKTDVYGNKFIACEDCGSCLVETARSGKIYVETE